MKKKLIVTTVLILLLSVCLSLLVGCDEMFTRNEERDAKQIVATVNYGNQTEHIYKFELQASYNSYSYAYVNYYGMTPEAAADYILQSLAQQKLLVMFAKDKVSQLMDFEAIPEDITKLLTRSELKKAVDDANNNLLSALKTNVENFITEDNYNSGSNTAEDNDDDEEEVEVTDPVFVRFDSHGGSSVERQRIQKDTKAKKPADPTREGYTFYGWYENEKCEGEEFDFSATIPSSRTLHAKWIEYVAPRTEMPKAEEEEDEDYDADNNDENIVIPNKFFSKEYYDTLIDEFKEEDFVKKMAVADGKTFEETLKEYIDNGLAKLRDNIETNTFIKTDEARYEYYLNNQIDSLLVAKLQRLLGKSVTVSDKEVEDEFKRIVAKNKETFTGENADSSYSSALTGSLDSTYFHTSTEESYGFVINILLKLDDASLKVLTDICKSNPSNPKALTILRNRLISDMTVKVSNPKYDSTAKVQDNDGNDIDLRDPMTDENNPYNGIKPIEGYDANKYHVEGGNNYNQLINFKKTDDGKFEIVYGATEHPAMAYLLESVPAFDKDGKVGIIHQIYNSFNQVKSYVGNGLTREQGVYWLREVATKWLYLVGDDSGAVTDSSNNKGLGYLITPEGKDSTYLEDFTSYARKLIAEGTGTFALSGVDEDTFKGTSSPDGTIDGNGVAFVVADSFIGQDVSSYDNAYAGVFVLLNSYTVWDKIVLGGVNDGVLPIDYIMTAEKDAKDNKSIKEVIYDSLLKAKQTAAYNLEVNTMGSENMQNIQYFAKAYKSIWKDASK